MTQELAPQSKAMNLRKMLSDYRSEIAHALPKHVSPDRMLRMAMTSARKNPGLLDCTPESFFGAAIQCAQLGLEPDTALGHCYLIPFQNRKSGKKEVQFMPGYRGLMDLVYRVAEHPILTPRAVYEGDTFSYEFGLNPKLVHTPLPRQDKAKLIFAYCVASFKDGRKEFCVMTKPEIEDIRLRSKATGFSPWQTDYEAMALKTVIRRMVKYLPMSAELHTAVHLDEMVDIGKSQDNDLFLKEGQPLQTKSERVEDRMKLEPGDFGFNEGDEHA